MCEHCEKFKTNIKPLPEDKEVHCEIETCRKPATYVIYHYDVQPPGHLCNTCNQRFEQFEGEEGEGLGELYTIIGEVEGKFVPITEEVPCDTCAQKEEFIKATYVRLALDAYYYCEEH